MAILLTVNAEEAGQKLFNFLLRCLVNEKADLHRWIRSGQVRINSGRAKAFDRVNEGDIVRVPPFAEQRGSMMSLAHEDSKSDTSKQNTLGQNTLGQNTSKILQYTQYGQDKIIEKIYENEHILVINKPFDLPCQGGTGHKVHLVQILKDAYQNARFTPSPAHRLDKHSTGLVLIGKSYKGLRFLSDFMQEENQPFTNNCLPNNAHKEYLTWVYGDLESTNAPKNPNRTHGDLESTNAPKNPNRTHGDLESTNAPKNQNRTHGGFKNSHINKPFYMVHYLYQNEELGRMQALSLNEVCKIGVQVQADLEAIKVVSNTIKSMDKGILFWGENSGINTLAEQMAVAKQATLTEHNFLPEYILPEHITLKNKANSQAKIAFSLVECIKKQGEFSLLKIGIFTGRKHQIRVQCAHLGFPLVGDGKYGRKSDNSLKLHAYCIRFSEVKNDLIEVKELKILPTWDKNFSVNDL